MDVDKIFLCLQSGVWHERSCGYDSRVNMANKGNNAGSFPACCKNLIEIVYLQSNLKVIFLQVSYVHFHLYCLRLLFNETRFSWSRHEQTFLCDDDVTEAVNYLKCLYLTIFVALHHC